MKRVAFHVMYYEETNKAAMPPTGTLTPVLENEASFSSCFTLEVKAVYRCGLYLNETQKGDMQWSVSESKITVWASCLFEEGYIYKAHLHGADGKSLYLGVMAPEGGRFHVSKSFLHRQASWLLESGSFRGEIRRFSIDGREDCFLPFPLHEFSTLPDAAKTDSLFRSCCQGAEVLFKDGYAVFPFEFERESAFSAFLTISTIFHENGQFYGVVRVDKEGRISACGPL